MRFLVLPESSNPKHWVPGSRAPGYPWRRVTSKDGSELSLVVVNGSVEIGLAGTSTVGSVIDDQQGPGVF